MTIVKEHTRQFHSPGASSSEKVSRVRFTPNQSEGRNPRKVNRFGKQSKQASGQQCWRCGGKHAPQACKFKFEKMFPMWQNRTYCEAKGVYGNSMVRSMSEESPDEKDDHFMVYSTHTVDALKSSCIRVSLCIEGTTFDMQLTTMQQMCRCCQSLYRKHLSHLPLLPTGTILKTYETQTVRLAGKQS